jgi:hypothetical protein
MDIVRWRRQSGFLGLGKVLAKSRQSPAPHAKLPASSDRSDGPSSASKAAIKTVMPFDLHSRHCLLRMQFFSFSPISSTEHNSVVRTMVLLDPRKDPSYCNKYLMEMEKE